MTNDCSGGLCVARAPVTAIYGAPCDPLGFSDMMIR